MNRELNLIRTTSDLFLEMDSKGKNMFIAVTRKLGMYLFLLLNV